jgi:hypothetical protein
MIYIPFDRDGVSEDLIRYVIKETKSEFDYWENYVSGRYEVEEKYVVQSSMYHYKNFVNEVELTIKDLLLKGVWENGSSHPINTEIAMLLQIVVNVKHMFRKSYLENAEFLNCELHRSS